MPVGRGAPPGAPRRRRVLVTALGSYAGRAVAEALAKDGCDVDGVDTKGAQQDGSPAQEDKGAKGKGTVRRLVGELWRYDDAATAVAGCDAVVHIAQYGAWDGVAAGAMQHAACQRHHGDAFANVVRACVAERVGAIVLVSHAAAAHADEPRDDGKEASGWTPAKPRAIFGDAFARSCHALERDALVANGAGIGAGGAGALLTVVLRPGRLYGEGEPLCGALASAARRAQRGWPGAALFPCGPPEALANWIHADNLAAACCAAVNALLGGQTPRIHTHDVDSWPECAGKLYHVSDGSPVNSYAFAGTVLAAAGYDGIYDARDHWPRLVAIALAHVASLAHAVCGTKLGCTVPQVRRWCDGMQATPRNDAATRDFGYTPVLDVPTAVSRTVTGLVARGLGAQGATRDRYAFRRRMTRAMKVGSVALFAAVVTYLVQMLGWMLLALGAADANGGDEAALSGGYVDEDVRLPAEEFEGGGRMIEDDVDIRGVRWSSTTARP